jgi:hypothetical protein
MAGRIGARKLRTGRSEHGNKAAGYIRNANATLPVAILRVRAQSMEISAPISRSYRGSRPLRECSRGNEDCGGSKETRRKEGELAPSHGTSGGLPCGNQCR